MPASLVAADSERTVKKVQFAKGSSSAVIKGRISGYNYIDYQLRAEAGQRMKVTMQVTNLANYYNILPPGSPDAAMYVGELGENRFDGLLPDDGVYTVRVYLMRSAAGREETSDYMLSVFVTGKPLPPESPKIDAAFPGTHYDPCAAATISDGRFPESILELDGLTTSTRARGLSARDCPSRVRSPAPFGPQLACVAPADR